MPFPKIFAEIDPSIKGMYPLITRIYEEYPYSLTCGFIASSESLVAAIIVSVLRAKNIIRRIPTKQHKEYDNNLYLDFFIFTKKK